MGGEGMRPQLRLAQKQSRALRIRLRPDLDNIVRKAAKHAGVSVSNWTRLRLVEAARAELR